MNLSLPFFAAEPVPAPVAAATPAGRAAPGSAGAAALPAGSEGINLALHPAVWRASQIGGGALRTSASGFAALDAQLPGGGWPHGVLTELLLPQPGIGELRLLAPALAALGHGAGSGSVGAAAGAEPCVMLFDPPASLSAWALAQCGLSARHWLVVQARAGQGRGGVAGPQPLAWRSDTAADTAANTAVNSASRIAPAPGLPRGANRLAPLLPAADLLWALEQTLKSGHVGAVLAWLPVNLRADALRRLQLAAQAQAGPVFLFRDALARNRPSAAPLRLLLQPAGVDGLSLRLLKRRGPLLAQPLRLQLPPVLTQQQQATAEARQWAREQAQRLDRAAGPAATGSPGLQADQADHADHAARRLR